MWLLFPHQSQVTLSIGREAVISYSQIKAIDYSLPLSTIREQKCRIKIFSVTQTLWNSYQLSVLGSQGSGAGLEAHSSNHPVCSSVFEQDTESLPAPAWSLTCLRSEHKAQRDILRNKIKNNENRNVGSCGSCAEVCLNSAMEREWLIRWCTWKWGH